MIHLQKATASDRDRLWNLLQKYLYELSAYYELEMDSAGNYAYAFLDSYFTDSARTAYFLLENGTPVGFALINDYSCLQEQIDYAVAEFSVFPRYRRSHCGREAVREIFRQHRGKWEIKFHTRNSAAKSFWLAVTAAYAPRVTALDGAETVLSFAVK